MMRLFIAEKPELARAIVDGLDGGQKNDGYYQCGDDRVTWCIGHMLVLKEPRDFDERYSKWNLDDLPIDIPIEYKPNNRTRDQLDIIMKLMQEADSIVHAGDNDAEGQLIVDELLEYAGNSKPVARFLTNDNNTIVVKKALANMKDNKSYYPLYQSALARNVGDQIYGFNMTRAYTVAANNQGFNGMLGVGRVQTPILGLVVNRDRANSLHEKQFYFDVNGVFLYKNIEFKAKLSIPDDAPIDDKGRISDKDYSLALCKNMDGSGCIVTSVDVSNKDSAAPLPYNMLKLQADASKFFGYKPDEVMKISQELRETHRLITYNGSDCQYLNEEQHDDAKDVLSAISKCSSDLLELTKKADYSIKSRAFNNKNVSAHHAIIPTTSSTDISKLSEKLRNIYIIIAKHYIAQFYNNKKFKVTELVIESGHNIFLAKSSNLLTEGWGPIFSKDNVDEDQDDEISDIDLSQISIGDDVKCLSCGSDDKETKPPALYTISTLLNDLTRVSKYINDPEIRKLLVDKDKDKKGEHGGIGTSRTRDQIIKRLFDAGYIKDKGKKVVSSDIGKQFFDALPIIATSPDMTALWHQQQTLIESGESSCSDFITELREFIKVQVNFVKNGGINLKIDTYKCPSSDHNLSRKKGKDGFFWGCNGYPECKVSVPDKAGKPDLKSLERTPCEACQSPLKRIKGQFGFFWPCAKCSINFKDKRGKPDFSSLKPLEGKHKCTDCDGILIRRPSKKNKGEHWYGCSGFPKCTKTFLELDGEPNLAITTATDHKCSSCKKSLIRKPSKKVKNKFWYSCSAYPECKETYQEYDNKPKYLTKES